MEEVGGSYLALILAEPLTAIGSVAGQGPGFVELGYEVATPSTWSRGSAQEDRIDPGERAHRRPYLFDVAGRQASADY
jgi:hypothetical protein